MSVSGVYIHSIGTAFAALGRTAGDRPALRLRGGATVTYRALDERANRIAWTLRRRGVARGDVVAIVADKTVDGYAAMFACLKLGAPYVNLDDRNPTARLRHMLEAARPRTILLDGASADLRARFAALGPTVLDLSGDLADDVARASDREPDVAAAIAGSDPAYVMFTSGSTGVPKGAVITHGGVLNLAAWAAETFALGAADVLTGVNPSYFDNSVFDTYASLLNGASLAPIDRTTAADPDAMLAALEAAGATLWFSVPSLLVYLTTLGFLAPDRVRSLRTIAFGGEAYPKTELHKLIAAVGPERALFNVYGPTECTCICSARRVTAEDLAEPLPLVALGPVAPNFTALVLDEALRPVGAGETGELFLGGPQVGAGYINDRVRTAAAFVQNPTHTAWHDRMYRTGDLVRFRSDGRTLDFVGRKDHQIKHMGYRIELEEIEHALCALDDIVEAAVVHASVPDGPAMLVAFVSTDRDASSASVRDALCALLPPYMLPERVVVHRTLPKNANGKIDRHGLREAAREAAIGSLR